MKKKKYAFIITISFIIAFVLPLIAYAHPGRTDSNGGHTDHSTGEYHYHHGYPAHSHYDMDGDGDVDCPYDFNDQTNHDNSHSSSKAAQSGSSPHDYEDTNNIVSTSTEQAAITFGDILNALLSSLLPAIAILFCVSYFSFYVFWFFLGENKGCSVAIIFGVAISIIAYIWFIVLKLT